MPRAKLAITFASFMAMLSVASAFSGAALADRGMISPSQQAIYEPGQKAIIAWDGATEMLYLATDVYAESQTSVLEIIPLPALPNVTIGDPQTLQRMSNLMDVGERKYSGGNHLGAGDDNRSGISVAIVFHEQIGAHNITVVLVNDTGDFENWVVSFLEQMGVESPVAPPKLTEAMEGYLTRGINYLVFDQVEAGIEVRSVEPLVYRFASDTMYYPLALSSVVSGRGEITLFCVTDRHVDWEQIESLGFRKEGAVKASESELQGVDPALASMLPDGATVRLYTYYGFVGAFTSDISAKATPVPNPYLGYSVLIVAQSGVIGGTVLLIGRLCKRLDRAEK